MQLTVCSPMGTVLQTEALKVTFETLNGFLISLLEKIPTDGETTELHAYGYDFFVKKVEDNTIREVLVKKSKEDEESNPKGACMKK